MPLNFTLAGKTYTPVSQEVTAESIAAYAAASRIDNPRHAVGDGQVAPIVYPVVYGLPLMAAVTLDPELALDNPLMIVHGEEEIAHHRPLRPGETLVCTPSLESVEDKGKGATYVSKVTAVGGDGELVNEQWATIFVRGAGSGTDRPRTTPPPPPARNDQVAVFTRHVDVGMPKEYAVASGDHNPIHQDENVARMVGLPGVINHGLGTLSIVTGGLVDSLAGGDPTRVTRLQVRFTDMVIPGSDLETKVWASDDATFVFETTRPDGNVVMTGLLTVAAA